MSYSTFCSNCGDYFSSKDKKEVKKHKDNHKIVDRNLRKYCPLQMTQRGTLARPELAIQIDREEQEKINAELTEEIK